MTVKIAYLGPVGTYSETAALAFANSLPPQPRQLIPYPSIALALRSVVQNQADLAVVPVENSTEGSVVMTLDALWQLPGLQIQQELVLPISHALLSPRQSLTEIKTVYSHPQALAQCQKWLENNLPNVPIIPTNSTTEAIQILDREANSAAIASPRAAKLYNVPILTQPINSPDGSVNWTKEYFYYVYGQNTQFDLGYIQVNIDGSTRTFKIVDDGTEGLVLRTTGTWANGNAGSDVSVTLVMTRVGP